MLIEEILNELVNRIESRDNLEHVYTVSNGTNNGFEKLVPEILDQISNVFPNEFECHVFYGHHFPDLEIKTSEGLYGVELKSRKKEEWTTNGNSVFESISDENYDEIYLLFGSLNKEGKRYSARYKPYWQVTSGIAVTHSPRFKIDMRDTEIESVFQSSEEYKGLRDKSDEEKIQFLQTYLKKNTDKSKWYIPQETESVKPIQFKELDNDVRDQVLAETMVLFPHDLIKKFPSGMFRGEYGRSTEYLLEQYFYFTPSLRDSYSAGGAFIYRDVKFPQVIARLKSLQDRISKILEEASEDFKKMAYKYWGELNLDLEEQNFSQDYDKVLDSIGKNHLEEELQKAGISSLSKLYHS